MNSFNSVYTRKLIRDSMFCLSYIFFIVFHFSIAQAQSKSVLSKKEHKRLNGFNQLFNTSSDSMSIPQSYQTLVTIIKDQDDLNYLESEKVVDVYDGILRTEGKYVNIETISLKFDELGCLIPDNYIEIPNLNLKKVEKVFNKDGYRTIKKLQLNFLDYTNSRNSRFKYKRYWDYKEIQEWNNIYLEQKINIINSKIRNKKNIVFYIHGYNVSYSMAQLQTVRFKNYLDKNIKSLDPNSTIIINLYWPSNNQKKINIGFNNGYLNKFKFKDKLSYRKSGTPFKYVSNTCYFVGISLRSIFNELDTTNKPNIYVFSHSLGATIATTSVINTISKIDFKTKNLRDTILIDSFNNIRFKKPNYKIASGNDDGLNYAILKLMESTKLPTYRVKFFLNAPAIPGVKTFKDMDTRKNYFFTIGYNPWDEKLDKRFLGWFRLKAKKHSSTTLGGDYHNEVAMTKMLFENENKFKSFISSTYTKHDIFQYMDSELFKIALLEFFKKP